MLRSTTQVSISELYMERSTRKVDFLKVKNLDILGGYGKRNKKNISKRLGNKRKTCIQWNIII
ncbi:MAG: hypothetical protein ACMUEL_05225 [Flavobacteriales bacterium Tduv]